MKNLCQTNVNNIMLANYAIKPLKCDQRSSGYYFSKQELR